MCFRNPAKVWLEVMKREAQTIEYKSSWHEDYFGWIAGYANASGGTLYIGVNDDGYVVGIDDVHFLLDVRSGGTTH